MKQKPSRTPLFQMQHSISQPHLEVQTHVACHVARWPWTTTASCCPSVSSSAGFMAWMEQNPPVSGLSHDNPIIYMKNPPVDR